MSEPVDGMAAASTMLGFGTWRPGHCLEAVWQAYSRNGAQDRTGQSEPTAYDAWLHSPTADRRGGSFDSIPGGVPVYFGPKASSSAGDIVISIGGGMCVATDIPGQSGVIGKMRLSDRQAQIGRPYLGWTTSILAYPIDFDDNKEDEVKANSFVKSFELDTNKTQTISEGTAEFLRLEDDPINTKIVSGPNIHVSAVLSLTFKNLAQPSDEFIQVEPFVSTRQSDNSLKDASLHRQEVPPSAGLTRVKVPIECRLSSADKYLRVKVFAPAGAGDALVTFAELRGVEFTE